MPTCPLPPWEDIAGPVEKTKAGFVPGNDPYWRKEDLDNFIAHFDKLKEMLSAGQSPPPWRMDAAVASLGDEWVLVAFSNEMFCQYELWVNDDATFKHNMTLGLTNGATGYVADDHALAMGPKGGYEAACLPYLGSCDVMTQHFNPPAVGAEKIIKNLTKSLWE
jgi:hypothetical protein